VKNSTFFIFLEVTTWLYNVALRCYLLKSSVRPLTVTRVGSHICKRTNCATMGTTMGTENLPVGTEKMVKSAAAKGEDISFSVGSCCQSRISAPNKANTDPPPCEQNPPCKSSEDIPYLTREPSFDDNGVGCPKTDFYGLISPGPEYALMPVDPPKKGKKSSKKKRTPCKKMEPVAEHRVGEESPVPRSIPSPVEVQSAPKKNEKKLSFFERQTRRARAMSAPPSLTESSTVAQLIRKASNCLDDDSASSPKSPKLMRKASTLEDDISPSHSISDRIYIKSATFGASIML